MERPKVSREFKFEAVRLIKERGVSCVQPPHDLGVHQSVLRREKSRCPQHSPRRHDVDHFWGWLK
jgi:transposase-like protein